MTTTTWEEHVAGLDISDEMKERMLDKDYLRAMLNYLAQHDSKVAKLLAEQSTT
jgi:hypothetical protein